MCGGKPSTPAVVQPVDPQVAADKAAAEAAAKANEESAARRASRKSSALATGAGTQQADSALAYGKTTLGS